MIKESDYSKYAEAKEKLELAENDLEDEVLKTKAIVLLQKSLEALKEDKMESIYPVLQTIINQVAGHLYGNGAKIILNKDGFPESWFVQVALKLNSNGSPTVLGNNLIYCTD